MNSKYFKTDGYTVRRNNGVVVGNLNWDSVWQIYRFIPKENFDFDSKDLIDLGKLVKKV